MKEINVLKNFKAKIKASPNGYRVKEYIKGTTDNISDELFMKLKDENLFKLVEVKEVVEKKVAKPNYTKKVITGNYSKKESEINK